MTKALAKSGRESAIRDVFAYLPGYFVPAAIAVASTYLFTRLFSPYQLGIVGLLGAVSGPIASAINQGFAQPVGRFYSEYREMGREALYKRVVGILCSSALLLTTGLSLLGVAVWYVFSHHENVALRLGIPAAIGMMVGSVTPIVNRVVQSRFLVSLFRQVRIYTSLLSFLMTLLFIELFGRSVQWTLWGPALATLTLVPLLFKKTGLRFHVRYSTGTDRTEEARALSRSIRFGLPMIPWYFTYTLLDISDRYLIQMFLGASFVGIYGANYNMVSQGIGMMFTPLVSSTWPRVMHSWGKGDAGAAASVISDRTELYLMIAAAAFGLLMVDQQYAARVLLGEQFYGGHGVMIPVAGGIILFNLCSLGHLTLELSGRNYLMLVDGGIATIVNVLLNILMIPRYGIMAAAYDTLIAYSVYFVLLWLQTRSHVKWIIRPRGVLPPLLASLAGILVCMRLPTGQGALIELIWRAFVFMLVYGGVTLGVFKYRKLIGKKTDA